MNPKLRERILQETVSPLLSVSSKRPKSLPNTPKSVRRAPTPIPMPTDMGNRSNSVPELPSINGNKRIKKNRPGMLALRAANGVWSKNLSNVRNHSESFLKTSEERDGDLHKEFWASGSPEWNKIFKSLTPETDSFLPTLTRDKIRTFNSRNNHRRSCGESTATTSTNRSGIANHGAEPTEGSESPNENKLGLISLSTEPLTKSKETKLPGDLNNPPADTGESDVKANAPNANDFTRLWEWLSDVNREISML